MSTSKLVELGGKGPQVEDGFLRLANELYDAVLRFGFSGRQLHVLLAVVRKTYGYGKKVDDVTASQLGALCGIARNHVTTTLKQLERMNVVVCEPGRYGLIVGINKRHTTWVKPVRQSDVALLPVPDRDDAEPIASPASSPVSGLVLVPDQDVQRPVSGPSKDKPKNQLQQTNLYPRPVAVTQVSPRRAARSHLMMSDTLKDRFDRFWQAYPRKVDKQDARDAFARLMPDEALLDLMLESIRRSTAAGLWSDVKYVKHASTWLNSACWEDEVQCEYDAAAVEVIEAYNAALGEQLGTVSVSVYSTRRAGNIAAFIRYSDKPKFWLRYFAWVREHCALPPNVGFDWMISPAGFSNVAGGQHERRA
ncbi:replication protein [Pigmentiphaga aceris]|uniref:replication protein n=1 Tax=Pigmentiphaga aceris TaxID=1940612 RepID=UPI001CA367A2|nr:replication protein [Pigmentiphaga aceris]